MRCAADSLFPAGAGPAPTSPPPGRRASLRIALAALALGAAAGPLQAAVATVASSQGRFALVIGNAGYARSPLRFTHADAQLMTATLRDLGFAVTLRTDLARQPFHEALDDFVAQLREGRDGSVAIVYYAGHGIQLEGLNFLIPVDRALQSMADVRDYGIPADRLMRQLGEANARGVNVVVLDACRSNPFRLTRGPGPVGLAPVDSPRGTLVAYSTDPGRPALDGGSRSGHNSIYTEALAESMRQPGIPLEAVFKRVRTVVADATQGRQTPWENTSLRGDFFLVPR